MGSPSGSAVKNLQCRRCGFDPRVGKLSRRRKQQPTPGFLPGESHGQRSLEGYSPQGCKELDTTECVCTKRRQGRKEDLYLFNPTGMGKIYSFPQLNIRLCKTNKLFQKIKKRRKTNKQKTCAVDSAKTTERSNSIFQRSTPTLGGASAWRGERRSTTRRK